MRFAGSASPEAMSAERTRSRDSATALSASPTIMKTTLPAEICTCTSTARASMPSKATVDTRVTMPAPHNPGATLPRRFSWNKPGTGSCFRCG